MGLRRPSAMENFVRYRFPRASPGDDLRMSIHFNTKDPRVIRPIITIPIVFTVARTRDLPSRMESEFGLERDTEMFAADLLTEFMDANPLLTCRVLCLKLDNVYAFRLRYNEDIQSHLNAFMGKFVYHSRAIILILLDRGECAKHRIGELAKSRHHVSLPSRT
jgi:hypothetical protein